MVANMPRSGEMRPDGTRQGRARESAGTFEEGAKPAAGAAGMRSIEGHPPRAREYGVRYSARTQPEAPAA